MTEASGRFIDTRIPRKRGGTIRAGSIEPGTQVKIYFSKKSNSAAIPATIESIIDKGQPRNPAVLAKTKDGEKLRIGGGTAVTIISSEQSPMKKMDTDH